MDPNSQANGNHPGIIEFKGNSYVFGFNWRLQENRTGARNKEMRSVSVEKFAYNADGTIPKLPFWSEAGPAQVGTFDPYAKTEAETMAWGWDVRTETCSEGGLDVTSIDAGDYIKVKGVDFGVGATSLALRVASTSSNSKIEVRLDSQTGKLVGTCAITATGGAQTWATQTCAISGASAVHDLFFVFTGGSGSLLNFNWWRFIGPGIEGGTGGAGGGSGTGQGGASDAEGGNSGSGARAGTPTVSGGAGGSSQGGAQNAGGTVNGGRNAAGETPGSGGQTTTGGTSHSSTGGTAHDAGGATSGTAPSQSGCACIVSSKGSGERAWGCGVALLAGIALVRRRGRRRMRVTRSTKSGAARSFACEQDAG
jgi:hypothetical protein